MGQSELHSIILDGALERNDDAAVLVAAIMFKMYDNSRGYDATRTCPYDREVTHNMTKILFLSS